MIKIIIVALAAVLGFSGGSNKVDNVKIYDHSFNCPSQIEYYQGRTNQLMQENKKIIEVLKKYGYSEN